MRSVSPVPEGQRLQEDPWGRSIHVLTIFCPLWGTWSCSFSTKMVVAPWYHSDFLAPGPGESHTFSGILPPHILPYLPRASILVRELFINHSEASPELQGHCCLSKKPLSIHGHYEKCTNCHMHFHLLKAVVFKSSSENENPIMSKLIPLRYIDRCSSEAVHQTSCSRWHRELTKLKFQWGIHN